MKETLFSIVVAVALLAGACGGSPERPTPSGPVATCPADVQVQSLDGGPMPVTYSPAVASGGSPPVSVTCSPGSGATLAVGVHVVTCAATDAAGRTGSCTFNATVKAPPRLTPDRFLAFGDSLTWGVVSAAVTTLAERLLMQQTVLAPPPPTSYPSRLQDMLRERYRTQSPAVYNEGVGGEKVTDGLARLPEALDANHVDTLLLMEGTNDLLDYEAGAERALVGLRQMTQYARQRGLRVFLATVPPQRAGGVRHRDRVAQLIPGFNDQIRALASSERVPVVDVYDALKDKLYLIGVDDLHPTTEGYVVIAQTFFDAIRAQLDVSQSAPAAR